MVTIDREITLSINGDMMKRLLNHIASWWIVDREIIPDFRKACKPYPLEFSSFAGCANRLP